jgi:hypothetical protein
MAKTQVKKDGAKAVAPSKVKVIATHQFRNKDNMLLVNVGDEIEIEPERAQVCIKKGLAKLKPGEKLPAEDSGDNKPANGDGNTMGGGDNEAGTGTGTTQQ